MSGIARLVRAGVWPVGPAWRGVLAVLMLLAFSGCLATTKRVGLVETDLLRQRAWTDERLARIEEDIEALRAENDALRQLLEGLRGEFAGFGEQMADQVSNLDQRSATANAEILKAREEAEERDRQRETDREELLQRMNVILEEVVRENAALRKRIDSLESSAFTFGQMHRVQEGESVAEIARKYGVTPEAIVQANDLSDANLIHVGQELLIPGVSR